MQWGNFETTKSNPKTTTLPISCNTVLIAISPPINQTADVGHNVFESATQTSVSFNGSAVYTGTLYWIAICK